MRGCTSPCDQGNVRNVIRRTVIAGDIEPAPVLRGKDGGEVAASQLPHLGIAGRRFDPFEIYLWNP